MDAGEDQDEGVIVAETIPADAGPEDVCRELSCRSVIEQYCCCAQTLVTCRGVSFQLRGFSAGSRTAEL